MMPQEPRRPSTRSLWAPIGAALALTTGIFVWAAAPAPAEQPRTAVRVVTTDLEAGSEGDNAAGRARMVVPFKNGFWAPQAGKEPVAIPDDQMNVVGLNETTRIYARAGGGGGGPQLDWQAGDVFVRVAPGRYLPLAPVAGARERTPPPGPPGGDPKTRPAPKPQPR